MSLSLLAQARLEKLAADCGFDLSPRSAGGTTTLRSTQFPESVEVRALAHEAFDLMPSDPALLKAWSGEFDLAGGAARVQGFDAVFAALSRIAALARTRPNRVAERFHAETAALPRSTEAQRMVVQRLGQDLFRAALIDFWGGRCALTGLALVPLLRASHIKPWAACATDEERLDVYNGLLLAPQLDALFDGGWVSFADDGSLLVSAQLDAETLALLGVRVDLRLGGLQAEHRPYLAHHRRDVFRST